MRCQLKKVEKRRFLARMASLLPYFLAKNGCFWELFYLRCQLKKVEKRRFLAKMASPIALTFSLKMAVFGCPFICGAS